MKKGSILGVDLNEKSCQISYYNEQQIEPIRTSYGMGIYTLLVYSDKNTVLLHKQIYGASFFYIPLAKRENGTKTVKERSPYVELCSYGV